MIQLPVTVSDWKPAPFDMKGETVFAIGDVHGCAAELSVLLKSTPSQGTPQAGAG